MPMICLIFEIMIKILIPHAVWQFWETKPRPNGNVTNNNNKETVYKHSDTLEKNQTTKQESMRFKTLQDDNANKKILLFIVHLAKKGAINGIIKQRNRSEQSTIFLDSKIKSPLFSLVQTIYLNYGTKPQ